MQSVRPVLLLRTDWENGPSQSASGSGASFCLLSAEHIITHYLLLGGQQWKITCLAGRLLYQMLAGSNLSPESWLPGVLEG